MKIKEFNKIKKTIDPQELIYKHCHNKIKLTSSQIEELIKKRGVR